MGFHTTSYYVQTALEPKTLRARAKLALKGVQFDTFVGSGLSGLLPLLVLGEAFKVNTVAVRKPNDSSHADEIIEGKLERNWVFVDDFTCTAATFARVFDAIDTACWRREETHHCVGAFLYDACNKWVSIDTLTRGYGSARHAIQGARAHA